ncbi:MAG: DUF4981 domain-containing protein, partial [Candidatus Omnitrophica bacterium]|nr:DUF4981 domain-containing protein [Candidatus Omnitrophota bacterium]
RLSPGCNGLVTPDRQPHPGLYQVKHIYQYVHCRPLSLAERRIEVKNDYDFTNLKDIAAGQWRVTADGRIIQQGAMSLPNLPPQSTAAFVVPVKPFAPEPGIEYFLELSFQLKYNTAWANQGHELAWDQFKLPDSAPAPKIDIAAMPPASLQPDGERLIVRGKNFTVTFNRKDGTLASLNFNGT